MTAPDAGWRSLLHRAREAGPERTWPSATLLREDNSIRHAASSLAHLFDFGTEFLPEGSCR